MYRIYLLLIFLKSLLRYIFATSRPWVGPSSETFLDRQKETPGQKYQSTGNAKKISDLVLHFFTSMLAFQFYHFLVPIAVFFLKLRIAHIKNNTKANISTAG